MGHKSSKPKVSIQGGKYDEYKVVGYIPAPPRPFTPDLFSDEPQVIPFDGTEERSQIASGITSPRIPPQLLVKTYFGRYSSAKKVRGSEILMGDFGIGMGYPYRQSSRERNNYVDLGIFCKNIPDFVVMGDFRNATASTYFNFILCYDSLFIVMSSSHMIMCDDTTRKEGQERVQQTEDVVSELIEMHQCARNADLIGGKEEERMVAVVDGRGSIAAIRFKVKDITAGPPLYALEHSRLPLPYRDAQWHLCNSLLQVWQELFPDAPTPG